MGKAGEGAEPVQRLTLEQQEGGLCALGQCMWTGGGAGVTCS